MPAAPPEVGPYRVISPLGRGGTGTVWLADDPRLSRVAIKLFAGPEARSDDARAQLLREARAAAALNHPQIAAVHDIVDVDGQVAIVFEFVEGETLAARIARGPLDVETAVGIAVQLADGLCAAHQQGVVHRDLKPANVVVTRGGAIKILDFGVAWVTAREPLDETATVMTTPGFAGTIGYAAPEQCLGHREDARADIFSLGVLIYELLTGDRPFAGHDATTVLRGMLRAPTPRLASRLPRIPTALDSLVARMMSVAPAARPQTAREVRDELRALHRALSIHQSTPARRRRLWAAAAIVCVALTTGALVSSLALSRHPAAAIEKTPVVAVLPLTDASREAGNEYLAIGVADSLITRLASLESITVLSRAAVLDARQRIREMSALASELDAAFLVDGTVQRVSDNLRIALSLLRPDGTIEWAGEVEGRLDDIFGLQTRVASTLAHALEVQLSASDRANLAEQQTMNANALAAYWRGRAYLDRRDVPANIDAAIESFEEAAHLDPQYAAAHAARGEALWSRYLLTRRVEDARAATEAGTTALRRNPDSADVRYTLAVTLNGTGQLDAALEELQRALAIRENYEDARILLGRVLGRMGKTDQALAEFEKLTVLRPNYAPHHSAIGTTLYEAGRFREAASAFEQVTSLQPDNAVAHQQVGVAYQALGDDDRALEWYGRALAIRPYPQAYSNTGAIYHGRGEYAKAVEAYQRAIDIRPNARETHRNLGDAYTRMGRTSDAKRAYDRAVALTLDDLQVNPRDARALASLALYLQKAGRATQAVERLSEALAIGPADFEVLRRAAQVHALAGRTDEALNALEAALKHGFRRQTAANEEEFYALQHHPRFKSLTTEPAVTSPEVR